MTKERKIVDVVNNSSDRNEKPRKDLLKKYS